AHCPRTFGHRVAAHLPLDARQEIHAGARHGEAVKPDAYEEASVVVAKTADKADTEALSQASGLDVHTLKESFDSSPGYTAEMMTLTMIKWFLFVIAALVTGAFFLVWTIQRAGNIATLRAMGATKGFLLRDSLGQAVSILALSIVAGADRRRPGQPAGAHRDALCYRVRLRHRRQPHPVFRGPDRRGRCRLPRHPHQSARSPRRESMSHALNLSDVTIQYSDGDSQVTALDHVNLAVAPGEFVAIVGPSGSGKSTLLTVAGALTSPDSGRVE